MIEAAVSALVLIFSIIGYFLRQKDAEQGRAIAEIKAECLGRDAKQDTQIGLLFTKHDADAAALQELRLQIARDHYQKEELDARFDKLERAFKEGFSELGGQFSHLSNTLLQYIREEQKERRQ